MVDCLGRTHTQYFRVRLLKESGGRQEVFLRAVEVLSVI